MYSNRDGLITCIALSLNQYDVNRPGESSQQLLILRFPRAGRLQSSCCRICTDVSVSCWRGLKNDQIVLPCTMKPCVQQLVFSPGWQNYWAICCSSFQTDQISLSFSLLSLCWPSLLCAMYKTTQHSKPVTSLNAHTHMHYIHFWLGL